MMRTVVSLAAAENVAINTGQRAWHGSKDVTVIGWGCCRGFRALARPRGTGACIGRRVGRRRLRVATIALALSVFHHLCATILV